MRHELNRRNLLIGAAAAGISISAPHIVAAQAPALESWNDGPVKQSIIDFVGRVTREGTSDYVPWAERIAVFDNDGTLWVEQPIYTQFVFALDGIKSRAADHPEWKDQQPFKAVLEGDKESLIAGGEKALAEVMAVTHAGMTTDAFAKSVADWLATARDPRFNRRYDELVYQPMLELLGYLRNNGFKTYIVSGGGVEFMRVFAARVYGVPPEQVIGSSGVTKFVLNATGVPELMKEPKVEFVDDGPGKPVGINRFIGRRPIFAFGNSDGDLQMLQWTMAGEGPRFAGIVHHTDAAREYAYDRTSPIGKLDKALDAAQSSGWSIADMSKDWKQIFSFEQ
jgi:phosphoglycolate phosphatase-like HAD superfamily hydrolase